MKRKPSKRRKPTTESETVKVLRKINKTLLDILEKAKNETPPQIAVMPAPAAPIIIKLPPLDDGQTGTPAPWKPTPPPWQSPWEITCADAPPFTVTGHIQTTVATVGGTARAITWTA
jgi:hypothetical protein